MRRLLLPFALALLVPAASAQDDCSQADPCTWLVDVDADGLHGAGPEARWTFTAGDWFVLNATNFDAVDHVLSLDGHAAVRLSVPAIDAAETAPFQLAQPGTFLLRDDAGHTGTVVVTAADVNDPGDGADRAGTASSASSGTTGTGRAAPAPAAALLAAALLALASRRHPG